MEGEKGRKRTNKKASENSEGEAGGACVLCASFLAQLHRVSQKSLPTVLLRLMEMAGTHLSRRATKPGIQSPHVEHPSRHSAGQLVWAACTSSGGKHCHLPSDLQKLFNS